MSGKRIFGLALVAAVLWWGFRTDKKTPTTQNKSLVLEVEGERDSLGRCPPGSACAAIGDILQDRDPILDRLTDRFGITPIVDPGSFPVPTIAEATEAGFICETLPGGGTVCRGEFEPGFS